MKKSTRRSGSLSICIGAAVVLGVLAEGVHGQAFEYIDLDALLIHPDYGNSLYSIADDVRVKSDGTIIVTGGVQFDTDSGTGPLMAFRVEAGTGGITKLYWISPSNYNRAVSVNIADSSIQERNVGLRGAGGTYLGDSIACYWNDSGRVDIGASFANHESSQANGVVDITGATGGATLPNMIVGDFKDTSGNKSGFYWINGNANGHGLLPGGGGARAAQRPSDGWIVGWSTFGGYQHACYWTSRTGIPNDIGAIGQAPGGDLSSSAWDVNSNDWIVGTSATSTSSYNHAFYWKNETDFQPTDLTPTDSSYTSFARRINDSNEIPLYRYLGMDSASAEGLLWVNDTLVPLNDASLVEDKPTGFTIRRPHSISDNGWIVGIATDASGRSHAFALKPKFCGGSDIPNYRRILADGEADDNNNWIPDDCEN